MSFLISPVERGSTNRPAIRDPRGMPVVSPTQVIQFQLQRAFDRRTAHGFATRIEKLCPGSDQRVHQVRTRARARGTNARASFPSNTAARGHALARRAVRPVSHTPSRASAQISRAARAASKRAPGDGIAARKGCSQQSQKNIELLLQPVTNARRAPDTNRPKREASPDNHSREQPRAGILSAK